MTPSTLPVLEALEEMIPNYWRLAPVVQDGKMVGLFDVDTMLRMIRNQLRLTEVMTVSRDTTFSDWQHLIGFSAENSFNAPSESGYINGVVLFNDTQTILEAESVFAEWFARRELLSVICITPNGKAFEPLLGIVTAHDVAAW